MKGRSALATAAILACALAFSACGSNKSGTTTPPVATNVAVASSTLGVQNNYADGLFTSVTICAPNSTTNCQTIDNVLIDTASFGLRLLASQVTLGLTNEKDGSGNPLLECTQYQSTYSWGPVATADVQIAGEKASAVPIQLLGVTASGLPAAPSACTGSGLTETDSQSTLGANGVLGIGVFRHDCGSGCAPPQATTPSVYFSCPTSGCSPVLVPLVQQVQNPVALFSSDNNGVVIQMPAVPAGGSPTAAGKLIFGISTQSNNQLPGSATALYTDGYGNIATTYSGKTYSGTVVDTGSNAIFFLDASTLGIPACSGANSGFYCPGSTQSYQANLQSATSSGSTASAPVAWDVANADTLFATGYAAFSNLSGPNPGAFDFGMPFFYGKSVYVGINTASVGTLTGPFFAY